MRQRSSPVAASNDDKIPLTTDWSGECTRRGAYLAAFHNQFLSAAHTAKDVDKTIKASGAAMKEVAAAG